MYQEHVYAFLTVH